MMLHQDASRFARLPGQVGRYDLVVTLDDATSAIYSAFLVAEAGTLSSFRGIAEVIDRHGLFCELYTARGSHYFDTPNAGEAVSKTVRTQVAGPWPSSASATLRRTRPKPAAVPSAPFEPSKTACPRSWPRRGSSPSKRPTAGKSGSGVHPVPPGRAPGRQRQHRQMAWVAAANPVDPIASPFRAHFRARWRACTSIPTGSWRSSLVHTAWPNTDPMDHRVMMPNWPRDPLRRPPGQPPQKRSIEALRKRSS